MGSRWIRASVLVALTLGSVSAFGQTADELKVQRELKAARELFQEAFKDENEKRYPDALEKFQRVARVKESASVRYRIATVLAAMGRLREARDGYRALATSKTEQDIAEASAEKAAELDKRIPRLELRLDTRAPPTTRVAIDAAPVSVWTWPTFFELDPGEHVVTATAPGVDPYEQRIALPEGASVKHVVTFGDAGVTTSPPSPPKTSSTLPWILTAGGAALVVTGGAFLLAREGAIDDIETSCPNNVCATRSRAGVESDRDRAELFGPLGISVSAVGLVALGVGVYLLVRSPPRAATASHELLLPARVVF